MPTNTGSQDGSQYAYFAAARRLAVAEAGKPFVRVYDIGDYEITGFSQQQGSDSLLTFTSDRGVVGLGCLSVVQQVRNAIATPAKPTASRAAPKDEVLALVENLAALRSKGIVTDEEFERKKAELLKRL